MDRTENIRRIGEVSRLFVQTGLITLVAFISPYRADRLRVRDRVLPGDFIEVSKWQQVCKATSNISKPGMSFILLSLSMKTVGNTYCCCISHVSAGLETLNAGVHACAAGHVRAARPKGAVQGCARRQAQGAHR